MTPGILPGHLNQRSLILFCIFSVKQAFSYDPVVLPEDC